MLAARAVEDEYKERTMKKMISGYEVEAHTESSLRGEPARVVVHRIGSTERGYLTPEEAHTMGEYLIAAAKAAKAS